MTTQTDILNKELAIGDYVFVIRKNYRDMVLARVVKFTPKQCRVIYMDYSNRLEEYVTGELIKIEAADYPQMNQNKKLHIDLAYNELMGLNLKEAIPALIG